MRKIYFKYKKFLDFSLNLFDIGNPIGYWHRYDDNHFLNVIYKIRDDQFQEYYSYHLTHALQTSVGEEKEFYEYVWGLVDNRIRYYESQNPFSHSHSTFTNNAEKLRRFQKFLNSNDKWNVRPNYVVIAEKDEIIQCQEAKIEMLQNRLIELEKYEVAQKIRIDDDHLPTLIDLFQQIRKLELSSGRKLLRSDHKSPYSKMISKYFSHGGKDIPIETARNYFVEKKGDIPSKGTAIQQEHQIFKIVRVNNPEK